MSSPMYRQIAEQLREEIQSGRLAPGKQLPTEGDLKDRYNASRNTIRDAIKWLISLGLVQTRPGQGTFVVERIDPFVTDLSAEPNKGLGGGENATFLSQVREQAREAEFSEPVVEIQKALSDVAARMRVPEGTSVISRHQRRHIDGTPWSLQTSFYPRGFVAQGADRLIEVDDIPQGTVKYLSDTLGLQQNSYQDWIRVRAPDATEARFFNLPQDGRVGVFEIFRTAFDQTGRTLRLTVTVFPTDRNQFIVNVGNVPDLEEGTAKHKT
jgi:GntR family transcriptional regulator